jgi:hypothetical protein
VEELKNNLKEWNASWKISCCLGAILYRSFLDYLLNEAWGDMACAKILNAGYSFCKKNIWNWMMKRNRKTGL